MTYLEKTPNGSITIIGRTILGMSTPERHGSGYVWTESQTVKAESVGHVKRQDEDKKALKKNKGIFIWPKQTI